MDTDLITIFVFVLAVIALQGWFRLQRRNGDGLAAADQAALEQARAQVTRLEQRLDSLERILDDDIPGWRRKVSA